MSNTTDDFYNLGPEQILECIEKEGYIPTGRFIPLNSYENRVYLIYLEDKEPIVAKFYRPGRWSLEALNEEHLFMEQLKSEGLPVVNALPLTNKDTVNQWGSINYCFYPQHKGRMPYELLKPDIRKVARTLARLHNIGEQQDFEHRLSFDGDDIGWNDLDLLKNWIDPNILPEYEKYATNIINQYIDAVEDIPFQRVHGDCHRGNLLNNGTEFFFVDFDDCMIAPTAQDLWMVLAGDDEGEQTKEFLKAYEELRKFDRKQLKLFPLMQGIRIIQYSAWIAKRWNDPSFPPLFPHFNSYNYWLEEKEQLKNQLLQYLDQ